jgi:hypothetical protein
LGGKKDWSRFVASAGQGRRPTVWATQAVLIHAAVWAAYFSYKFAFLAVMKAHRSSPAGIVADGYGR